MCHDPDPALITVHTMQRDGSMYGDAVAVVFDTFGDRRRGYYFEINTAGARLDGLISGSEDVSTDWDGIWDARTRHTPDGWSAEIRIPAQSLRFTPGAENWGFNVQRWVARDRMMLRWTGTTLDASFEDLRRAGRLEGVTELQQGKGLSVSPFALAHRETDLKADKYTSKGDYGLDVTYNLRSEEHTSELQSH